MSEVEKGGTVMLPLQFNRNDSLIKLSEVYMKKKSKLISFTFVLSKENIAAVLGSCCKLAWPSRFWAGYSDGK